MTVRVPHPGLEVFKFFAFVSKTPDIGWVAGESTSLLLTCESRQGAVSHVRGLHRGHAGPNGNSIRACHRLVGGSLI